MGVAWRLGEGKDGKATKVRRAREEAVAVANGCRLKREDSRRTKHDCAFSKWEILIGPSDWESYSLGKDGAERYRTNNLPNSCSCPGIYELGIARLSANSRRFDPKEIVVVYLGQAENVRTRLQHYGRTGSHLEHGDSTVVLQSKGIISKPIQRRPGLFKEAFSKGFSIMFRWAPVRSKREALDAEARLLEVFDYAWNRIGNAAYRYEDIILKLDKLSRASLFRSFLTKLKPWTWKFPEGKLPQLGIGFSSSESFNLGDCPNDSKPDQTSVILELNKSQRIVVQRKNNPREGCGGVCGVIKEDGSVCERNPVLGRKRCGEHRGKRINRSPPVNGKEAEVQEPPILCGVVLKDGSFCSNPPPQGRKRCHLHKGRRVR
ncbi:unnamed protein product [Spirodela intermedia]|uniref:Uncharacterized protein n=1 Tax=Spirodela intermedia TaxID=51605 RepID=A0A7I8JZZ7_SPIIN|nr:unnamed protein product [Spirodela intermedia]